MLADKQMAFELAKSQRCIICKWRSQLVARWNGQANSYEVVCGLCGNPDRFEWIPSLTALWRRNPDSIPVTVANRLASRHRADIEAVAEGLPPELAAVVREKYFGPEPREKGSGT